MDQHLAEYSQLTELVNVIGLVTGCFGAVGWMAQGIWFVESPKAAVYQ